MFMARERMTSNHGGEAHGALKSTVSCYELSTYEFSSYRPPSYDHCSSELSSQDFLNLRARHLKVLEAQALHFKSFQ